MANKYTKPHALKDDVKVAGKQVEKVVLDIFDQYVGSQWQKVLQEHNGGRKRIDIGVLAYLGMVPKR